MTRRLFVLLGLGVALALAGCGGGKGDVSGVVKHRGQPVAGATITFYDETGKAWPGVVGSDGAYTVTGVPAGKVKITVAAPLAISMPGMPAAKITPLPPQYADAEKSTLTYQVKSGTQTHDIDLD